jgi:sugar O-acyltransferase (sialic acid O-acetyltransferase NeuD family)
MKETIILIGGGGHCKSCIDVIEQEGLFSIAGIVDKANKVGEKVLGYPVIGTDAGLPTLLKTFPNVLITLGQIKSPSRRIELFQELKRLGARFPIVRSPLAYVSPHAEIGEGTIIMHHSLINAGAAIGKNCIVNTKSLIEHDAVIQDHCHIATAAVVNGGVKVKTGTFFGSNAVTIGYIELGEKSFVNCGAKLEGDLPARSIIR